MTTSNSSGCFLLFFTPLSSHLCKLVCTFAAYCSHITQHFHAACQKKKARSTMSSATVFTSVHQQSLTTSVTRVSVLSWYAFVCDEGQKKPQHQQQNINSHTGNTSWHDVVSVVEDATSLCTLFHSTAQWYVMTSFCKKYWRNSSFNLFSLARLLYSSFTSGSFWQKQEPVSAKSFSTCSVFTLR